MKVSNRKGIANQTGPESCVAHREVRDEALTGEPAGQPLSRESFKLVQGADAVSVAEGNTDRRDKASACSALRGLRPWHVGTLFAREPGDLLLGRFSCVWSGPRREDEESKPMKNEQEKSDPSIVAKRPANKPHIAEVDLWGSGAESAEPREGTEGNTGEQRTCRTPSRESVSQGLERVREAAKQRKKERFTALLHHVTVDLLKDAYFWLKREAAPGVDGRTWQSYKQNLEVNLVELHSRIHRGTYRALPSRRRYIPKPDGRQRPLGIAALEDKIVQRAVVEVLNTIYEEDFLGFSYGFRPGRGQHDALDALAVGITRTKVNWIVDADIAGFFDAVSHEWLMRFR